MLDHDYENDPDLDLPEVKEKTTNKYQQWIEDMINAVFHPEEESSTSYITVTKPIMHSVTIIRKK